MEQFQAAALNVVAKINAYLSDYILIALLVGVGLYFTIRTGFVQVRYFGEGMKKVFGNLSLKGGKNKSGLTSFQALATAIAAQVGTGNIVGACGAILIGGPGAIFWMWIIAFFGMATIYAEATLAQKTRVVNEDGSVAGGPVYYIRTAFKGKFGKFLAGFFAIAITLALGFMGSMVQSNSIASSMKTAFGVPTWVIGAIVAVLCIFIFLGGIQRIASVTEKLVPVMAVFYLVGGLVILGIRFRYIPETFGLIFKYAFTPNALIGGGIGYALKTAISQGAKRGLFSNEAGMGSTPHAHAMANVQKPHDQGVVAMIGVFIDTFVVLTMTALVVISTLYVGGGPLGNTYKAQAARIAACNESQLIVEYEDIYHDYMDNRIAAIENYDDDKIAETYNKMYKTLQAESRIDDSEVKVSTVAEQKEKLVEYTYIDEPMIAVDKLTKETATTHIHTLAIEDKGIDKTNMMQTAFTNALPSSFGNFGNIFVAICLLFFAFSTILSWNFFGRLNAEYLFGKKFSKVYTVIAIAFIFLGSILSNDLVWELTDMFNNIMVIPNVLALFALGSMVVACLPKKNK